MAILLMMFRKLFNNRWLVGSLFLGLLITVALVSSIPSYTSGILQRMLVKELEGYQLDNQSFPGKLYQYVSLSSEKDKDQPKKSASQLHELENYFNTDIRALVGLPVRENVTVLNTLRLDMKPQDTKRYNPKKISDHAQISSLSHIDKHIKITDGRAPASEPVDGVYEAMVPEDALVEQNIVLGMVFVVNPSDADKDERLLIKPVGTFASKDDHSLYWFESTGNYKENFVIPESLFRKTFVNGSKHWLSSAKFYTAYDYHAIQFNHIDRMLTVKQHLNKHTVSVLHRSQIASQFPISQTLSEYSAKEKLLKTLLWSLNVPVLILMSLYLFMISRLIVDREQTEIAVLRSRGAGRWQIMFSYFLEVGILGGVALLLGPYLGLALGRILGASSGFLEFVQRKALPVHLTSESIQYALFAVVGGIIMVLIPVFFATKDTIVSRKQQSSRNMGAALWHKFYIDILLLLIALYGWFVYERRLEELADLSDKTAFKVDPLLFFVPALFIIGLGLFCLRLYPWFMRFVFWIGRRFWRPSMYTTLIQVSRSSKQYQFLMLFLIMTISVGIFSAGAARTINKNMTEQLRYANGADVRLKVKWENNAPPPAPPGAPEAGDAGNTSSTEQTEEQQASKGKERIQYSEPPFHPFTELPGVQHAAKVFQKKSVSVEGNDGDTEAPSLMAINPRDFGLTSWFKPQLLPHHWYAYLNLIAKEQSAVLVSRSLASRLSLKQGDYITVQGDNSSPSEFVVYGIIDYWPGWSPIPEDDDHNDESHTKPMLIVANLPYVQSTMGLEPYEVWLKMKSGASSAALYSTLGKSDMPITMLKNANQQVIEKKNDPFVLGFNGALTLGFLISMIVTFIGFLLYWILTLKGRVLQYGIFRAMGMSFRQLIGMMVWEQLLTSGIGFLLGVIIGGITSRLFVPLFQLSFGEANVVPPFQVIINSSDEIRLYVFIITMLFIGSGILYWLLSRIRIHQAVKLGED